MEPQATVSPPPVVPVAATPVVIPSHPKWPWILLVLALLLVVGSAGIFLGKQIASPTPTPIVAVPTVTTDPTASWKTYTNENGYSIKYPEDYEVLLPTIIQFSDGVNINNAQTVEIRKSGSSETSKKMIIDVLPPPDLTYEQAIKAAFNSITNNTALYIKTIEDTKNSHFLGKESYEFTVRSRGFNNGHIGFAGPEGDIKIISAGYDSSKVLTIGYYLEDDFNQILSTFKFTDLTSLNLKAPDSQSPAAGVCPDYSKDNKIEVATSVGPDNVPVPRCVMVSANQKLTVANNTSVNLTITLGSVSRTIAPGETFAFTQQFGSLLQPGVHITGGPEVWLQP